MYQHPPDNQSFGCTTFVWEVLTVHSNECACFGSGRSLYSNYLCRASDIAAVGTIFKVFSYDAVSDRDSNLSLSQLWMSYLLSHDRRSCLLIMTVCFTDEPIVLYFSGNIDIATSFKLFSVKPPKKKLAPPKTNIGGGEPQPNFWARTPWGRSPICPTAL